MTATIRLVSPTADYLWCVFETASSKNFLLYLQQEQVNNRTKSFVFSDLTPGTDYVVSLSSLILLPEDKTLESTRVSNQTKTTGVQPAPPGPGLWIFFLFF